MSVSSRFLTHPFPVWQGCTLNELLACFLFSALCGCFFGLLFAALIGYFLVFVLFAFASMVVFVFLFMKLLAKHKDGKPYGYFSMRLRLLYYQATKDESFVPYLVREGRWSTQIPLEMTRY